VADGTGFPRWLFNVTNGQFLQGKDIPINVTVGYRDRYRHNPESGIRFSLAEITRSPSPQAAGAGRLGRCPWHTVSRA
jgi:hypothetical protein